MSTARLVLYNASQQVIWDSSTVEGGILVTSATLAASDSATLSFPDFPGASASIILESAVKVGASNATTLGISISTLLGYPVVTKSPGSYNLRFTVLIR